MGYIMIDNRNSVASKLVSRGLIEDHLLELIEEGTIERWLRLTDRYGLNQEVYYIPMEAGLGIVIYTGIPTSSQAYINKTGMVIELINHTDIMTREYIERDVIYKSKNMLTNLTKSILFFKNLIKEKNSDNFNTESDFVDNFDCVYY